MLPPLVDRLAAAASSPSPGEVRAALRSVLDDGRYQTVFPGRGGLGRASDAAIGDPPIVEIPSFLADLAQALLWAGLVALAIVLLIWLGRVAWSWSPRGVRREAPEAALATGETPVVRQPAEAERLATEHRYAEAIHVLLLCAIDALQAHAPTAVTRSLTSRELLQVPVVPGESRSALATLVDAVERAVFAARPTGPAEYTRCLGEYRAFAERVGPSA